MILLKRMFINEAWWAIASVAKGCGWLLHMLSPFSDLYYSDLDLYRPDAGEQLEYVERGYVPPSSAIILRCSQQNPLAVCGWSTNDLSCQVTERS